MDGTAPPIRAIFELTYETWNANGVFVSEKKRFTVDAGHNLDQIESTFTVEGGAKDVIVAIGVNKNSGDKGQDAKAEITPNQAGGWFTQWEVQKTNGSIGEAIIVPVGLHGFAEDAVNRLVLAKVTSGQPLRYYVGGGWSKAGEFLSKDDWNKYVAARAAQIKSPVRVAVSEAK